MFKYPDVNWNVVHAEETRLLRAISPEDGARQFFALLAEFESWLRETERLFRDERNRAMIELQLRLSRLDSKRHHG
jgi:hypothetical protein